MSSNLSSNFLQFSIEMDKHNGHKIYQFNGFRLDADRMMLYRGDDAISLPPKAVKTLAVLVEANGEIICKDELIDAVWTDSIVEESNLSQYLYLLRKTLGKKPDGSPYIETLRRRGYLFTGNAVLQPILHVPEPEPQKKVGRSRHLDIERRGNVLALVDWKETEHEPKPSQEPAIKFTARPGAQGSPKLLVGSALLALLITMSGFAVYWTTSGASAPEPTEQLGEISITRLTNGIEVVDATISPDGKYFVYHEPDGKRYRIWLQQTGQSTRHEIVPASERVPMAKTFSPDSQQVYFLGADALGQTVSLYRVPTFGGPVTKVVSGLGSGVSLSPDGHQMVFSKTDKDGAKYVIQASDGSGGEKVLHKATAGLGSAAWSPDGRSIAIALQANPDNVSGGCYLVLVRHDTGQRNALSDETWDGCGRMEWAPDGRGLYMIGTRSGEAMTTRRDQVYYISYPQGTSRKLTSDGSRHQLASLGVTNDGSVMAVPYNRSSQIWTLSPRGNSRSALQITSGLNDGRSGIAPLADGRVAYISRVGENLNVWVMNSDGSEQKQITDNQHPIEELRSGSDGRYLVYAGYVDRHRSHLFRINTDGTGLAQMTSGDGREIDSSLSNDGKWIVFDSTKSLADKSEHTLWKQPIEGGERISLNRNDCQMPHFSPDDNYISCVREQQDILILSASDGSLLNTIRVPQSSTLSHTLNFGARWTPDGKTVAYIVNDKGTSNIWIHPIDSGEAKRLTDFTGGSIYHFAYSTDGQRLFVARGHQIRDAILISGPK